MESNQYSCINPYKSVIVKNRRCPVIRYEQKVDCICTASLNCHWLQTNSHKPWTGCGIVHFCKQFLKVGSHLNKQTDNSQMNATKMYYLPANVVNNKIVKHLCRKDFIFPSNMVQHLNINQIGILQKNFHKMRTHSIYTFTFQQAILQLPWTRRDVFMCETSWKSNKNVESFRVRKLHSQFFFSMKSYVWNNADFLAFFRNEFTHKKTSRLVHRIK